MADKELKLEERLIVAADFKPDDSGVEGIHKKVLGLAEILKGTGTTIKLNTVLRACGVELIQTLREEFDLDVMADFKIADISETNENDGSLLIQPKYLPKFLTVKADCGIDGMHRLKVACPSTEIMAVTVLTSLNEEECQAIYGCSVKAAVLKLARLAKLAKAGGIVCSPSEAEMLSKRFELSSMTLNTPAIRPIWSVVEGDDQAKSRVMTPEKAIIAGADRIIVGRPILNSKPNNQGLPESPREAVELTLREIEQALAVHKDGIKG